MSTSLESVLREAHLKPGRVYHCQVGDLHVEVRVEKQVPDLLPDTLSEADVMLDPWTDLPVPDNASLLQAEPGHLPLPDCPQIPGD